MKTSTKILTTSFLLLVLTGLGMADYRLSGYQETASVQTLSTMSEPSSMTSVASAASASSMPSLAPLSSIPTAQTAPATPPQGGVEKAKGIDVDLVVRSLGMETSASKDQSMLTQVVGTRAKASSLNILIGDDRAGSVTWVDAPQVKMFFAALKESLLQSFSPQVTGLVDEVQRGEGRPIINLLTFSDPSLSNETLTFIRIRERLYEFHAAPGKEGQMLRVIDALSQ